jgi:SAM-dependent methyltransferase
MAADTVFDREHYDRYNASRKDVLDMLLPRLINDLGIEDCIDVGCGVGAFTDYLRGFGLATVGLDGREGNVTEAARRFPETEFHVRDIAGEDLGGLGRYDLVLCLGLLYHLEDPFKAVRNLGMLADKVVIIESRVTPGRRPVATLVGEDPGEDQSLRGVAFIPSEACFAGMLHSAGFEYVYKVTHLADHEQFRESISRRRARSILAASRTRLDLPMLSPVGSRLDRDIWITPYGRLKRRSLRLLRKMRRAPGH